MLKSSLASLAALVLTVGLAGCSGDEPDKDSASDPAGESSAPSTDGEPCVYTAGGDAARSVDLPPDFAQYSDDVPVTISTTSGDLKATLNGGTTPCTVNSFVSLAKQGYYDDTPCPRISDVGLFILQCGDPSGTGAGGPGYSFEDELEGTETYPAGTLAMANAGPNTNGSQFFVVYEDSQLAPAYTVFGTIDQAGIDIVTELAADGNDGSNPAGGGAPNTPIDITGVTVD